MLHIEHYFCKVISVTSERHDKIVRFLPQSVSKVKYGVGLTLDKPFTALYQNLRRQKPEKYDRPEDFSCLIIRIYLSNLLCSNVLPQCLYHH